MNNFEYFGENLRRIIKARGFNTFQKAADHLGVSLSYLNQLMRNERQPSMEMLGNIAQKLQSSPLELLSHQGKVNVTDVVTGTSQSQDARDFMNMINHIDARPDPNSKTGSQYSEAFMEWIRKFNRDNALIFEKIAQDHPEMLTVGDLDGPSIASLLRNLSDVTVEKILQLAAKKNALNIVESLTEEKKGPSVSPEKKELVDLILGLEDGEVKTLTALIRRRLGRGLGKVQNDS